MTEFGVEQPIEDAIDQQTPVTEDDRPVELDTDADWEASEADIVDQRIEVPEDEP
ncbi:hypothetical protein LWC34_35705 [Kibdelosporangium philippinense]|uniref:Uncharacterized protein n=1 Tax=Kibdelosporangium philippinense TaxID=211113 RepID=A0ABS8ZME1_9PSEU|nr:hypothetical protein [Kibdelosporangium philippinense]MCE7008125.1 hypothetical protein [Kibdelosporangium philippinense]